MKLIEILEKSGAKIVQKKVKYNKKVFAGMIQSDKRFSKLCNSIFELIDNAIGAQMLLRNVTVYVHVFLHPDLGPTVVVMNPGVKVPDGAFDEVGNEEAKMSVMNKHGVGARAAAAACGKECFLVTFDKVTGEYKAFMLSDFTSNYCEITDGAELLWKVSEENAPKGTTTIASFSLNKEMADEVHSINDETIGLKYMVHLGGDKPSKHNKIMLKNEFNGDTDYHSVNPATIAGTKIGGTLTASLEVSVTDEDGNVHPGIRKCEICGYKMNDDKSAILKKGQENQGAIVFVNGELAEFTGVSNFLSKDGEPFQTHPSFNPRMYTFNFLLDEEDRLLDIPRDNNNKTSIRWGTKLGQQYASFMDKAVGDVFRELNDKWYHALFEKILEMHQSKAAMGASNINGNVKTSFFKNVSGSIFMKGLKNIDAMIAADDGKEYKDGKARPRKDGVGLVMKIIKTPLSPEAILQLAFQVAAVNKNGNNAFGEIYCKSIPDTEAIHDAMDYYKLITGKDLLWDTTTIPSVTIED